MTRRTLFVASTLFATGLVTGCVSDPEIPDGGLRPNEAVTVTYDVQFGAMIENPPALTEVSQEVIDRAKGALVIVAPIKDDQMHEGKLDLTTLRVNPLTGFIGADGKVYSALHGFIENDDPNVIIAHQVLVFVDGAPILSKGIRYELGSDVVQIDMPPLEKEGLKFADTKPSQGQTTYVAGFHMPDFQIDPNRGRSGFRAVYLGKSTAKLTRGQLQLRTGIDNAEQLSTTEEGWSGGPVVDGNGLVIGIVSHAEMMELDGLTYEGTVFNRATHNGDVVDVVEVGPFSVTDIAPIPPQFSQSFSK